MAVLHSRKLHLLLFKNNANSFLPVLGNKIQLHFQLVFHYSDSKISGAIKSYLEKAKKYDEFIVEQIKEYELGKKFLANMMGKKSQNLTQEDIDEAIEYLFPSRLFVPGARPMMKNPKIIFGNQKEAAFDLTGRPFSFLFYTTRPNYTHCLHNAAKLLEELNSLKVNPENPPKPLSLVGKQWLTREDIRKKFMENIYKNEYEKFIEVLNALAKHPFSSKAENFLKNYQKPTVKYSETEYPTSITSKDDVKVVTVERVRRKTSVARVSVSHPGSGQIRINNMHIDYFNSMNCRHQVSVIRLVFKWHIFSWLKKEKFLFPSRPPPSKKKYGKKDSRQTFQIIKFAQVPD